LCTGAFPCTARNEMARSESFDQIAQRMQILSRDRREEEAKTTILVASGAQESVEAEMEEAHREVGFSCRLLVQASLPHGRPPDDVTQFDRSNGFVTVSISGLKQYGLPYGTYPRLLLAYITSEAVRTKSPDIDLGRSLADFMTALGIRNDGGKRGSYQRLRQHMQRLFTATVRASYQRAGKWCTVGFTPIEGACLFWDPQNPEQGTLWESHLRLSRPFFDEIVHNPVPIDLGTLQALAKGRSPMAIDTYLFLTHRFSYLRKPTTISWEGLAAQFGGDYSRTRDFKKVFLRHLKKVVQVYPAANVQPGKNGLTLKPSRTHVPMRLIKG